MAVRSPINRVHDLAVEIAEQNAKIRMATAQAAEALKLPKPDTFLGRKTQEPFPQQDPMQRMDIQKLIHTSYSRRKSKAAS